MTVADWWCVTDRPANAMFMKDTEGFFELLATIHGWRGYDAYSF
jgi:hypothetical protein